jgi:hypothetical protein
VTHLNAVPATCTESAYSVQIGLRWFQIIGGYKIGHSEIRPSSPSNPQHQLTYINKKYGAHGKAPTIAGRRCDGRTPRPSLLSKREG